MTNVMMPCTECDMSNPLPSRRCSGCGISLRPVQARYYLDQAEAYITQGQYQLAEQQLNHADVEMLSLPPTERHRQHLTARAFWLQGSLYYAHGLLDVARHELLLAEQELGSEPSELLAETLNRLGTISAYQHSYAEAGSYYERSSSVALEAGATASAVRAFSNLGNTLLVRGQVGAAATCYTRALEQVQISGDKTSEGRTYRVLISLYSSFGPYPLALQYADRAMALRDQISDLQSYTLLLSEASTAYLRAGQFEQAHGYLLEAYARVRGSGNKLLVENVTANLCDLFRQWGDQASWGYYIQQLSQEAKSGMVLKTSLPPELIRYELANCNLPHAQRLLQTMQTSPDVAGTPSGKQTIARVEAWLHAAHKDWQAAAAYFEQAVSDPNVFTYERAEIMVEYATMLRDWAAASGDTETSARARATLEQAILLFDQIELRYRADALRSQLDPPAWQT